MNVVVRHLRRVALLQDNGPLSDGRLLEQFLRLRDEEAFAALLRRHGPMVLAVCRRVLGNVHDAEDAFQATFLVLARKAACLPPSLPSPHGRGRGNVGGWLHEVAYRTSMKARTMMARRRARERRAQVNRTAEGQSPAYDEDMLQLLDQELSRLPDKYRVPIILCALEGRSRKEAAGQLRISESKLSSRLRYGKTLLARRLRRVGVCPAVALPALTAQSQFTAGVSAKLVTATAQAALQVASGSAGGGLVAPAVSASVITLTEGVMKAMLLSKLKVAGAGILAVVVGAGGLGLTYRSAAAQSQRPIEASPATRPTRDELEELRLEIAALRKGLQATREQVKALQAEVEVYKSFVQAGLGAVRTEEKSGPAAGGTSSVPLDHVKVGAAGSGYSGISPNVIRRPDEAKFVDAAPLRYSTVPSQTDRFPDGPAKAGPADLRYTGEYKTIQVPSERGVWKFFESPKEANARPPSESFSPINQYPSPDADQRTTAAKLVADAEAALNRLRVHPGDKQATKALEQALASLKQQTQSKSAPGQPRNKQAGP